LADAAADAPPNRRWCGRPTVGWGYPNRGGSRLRAAVVGSAHTAEELGRAFPAVLRTSSGEPVLAEPSR
jgi:primosomal protein N' (replication factor Y)